MAAAARKPVLAPPIIAAEPAITIVMLVDEARRRDELYDMMVSIVRVIYSRAETDAVLQKKLDGGVLGTMQYIIGQTERR